MPGDVSGEQSGFVTEMIEKALTFVFGAQTAGGIPVGGRAQMRAHGGICGALLAVGARAFRERRKASGADGADRLRGLCGQR